MKTKIVILVATFLMLVVQPLSAWEVYFAPLVDVLRGLSRASTMRSFGLGNCFN
ncbi:MAG: hypothetical protein KAV99_07760 [Candidatus Latescibacteria bacterium]|nr:hypothetical protein [Candidatus Latescibacterota bacterium]